MAGDSQKSHCDCENVSRRDFLWTSSALAATSIFTNAVAGEANTRYLSETKVGDLYKSLDTDQRKAICFPHAHEKRLIARANWKIVEPQIKDLKPAQRDLVAEIFNGLVSPKGREMFEKQMADDYEGLHNYHIAIFGEPGKGKSEFVITGRHLTMRADGNQNDGVAFGGRMVYGHAADSFNEKPDHAGNVFWYQAKRANEVFKALDESQRKLALLPNAPAEEKVDLRKSGYPGLAVAGMSEDQKSLVKQVMSDLISPYRKEDADEVMDLITANGGLDKIHLAFYQTDDVGKDGVWDIWRLEGPGFVWHFRGAPHVHTWVNIAKA